jgi:hypothetical protein
MGADESGFWEVRSHDRSRSSFYYFFTDGFITPFAQDPL